MPLVALPDELLLQIIDILTSSYSKFVDVSPTAFYDWADRSKREASNSLKANRELLWLAYTCKRLYRLTVPRAWETVRWAGVRVSHSPPADQRKCVKFVHGDDHQRLFKDLRDLPRVESVALMDTWEYTTLFRPHQPGQAFASVRRLQIINSSLGAGALRDLYSTFPQVEEVHYELGAYETHLRETRNVWDPRAFGTALQLQSSTLKTLVLTRTGDMLNTGWRADFAPAVDLSAMTALKHLRIAEVFLFCLPRIRYHLAVDVVSRLPPKLESISVFHDEPSAVSFTRNMSRDLEETGPELWPYWLRAVAMAKMAGTGSQSKLNSVTVLEKAMPRPPAWPYLEDDENLVEEEPPNRELTPPSEILELFRMAGVELTVLVNVDKGRVI